jgi:ligand-binding sensor domain-containing protein
MKKILFTNLLLLASIIQAQSIKVGEWRDHLSYFETFDVCAQGDLIYTSTDKALFVYNKNDQSIERLNTLNGLSDANVSAISSNQTTLIVGYENGNLDIIENNKTENLADIKRASIIANKRINSINIEANIAYLSCGFGIVVLDIQKREIKDTYYIGAGGTYMNIIGTSISNNKLFAATEQGIYTADLNQTNLADFQAWEKMSFKENAKINLIETYAGKLFANIQGNTFNSDSLYTYDGANWELFSHPYSNVSLKVSDNILVVTSKYGVNRYNEDLESLQNLSSGVFNFSKKEFRAGIYLDGEYWIADKNNGLLHYKNGNSEQIIPTGPHKSDVAQIQNFGDEIWLAHGSKDENWDPTWSKNELSILKNDFWSHTSTLLENEIHDPVAIAQRGNITYVASWQAGLAELENKELSILYNNSNSSLQKRFPHDDWTNIGALEFDSQGNLWCTNAQTLEPLSVQYTNGEWESFSLGNTVTENQNLAKLLIDQNDQKWVQLKNNGIIVFDETRSGTKAKKISNGENNGNLNSDRVFSMAEDLDGEIWIGTDNGVCVFYDPSAIFEGEKAATIIVTQDGHNTHLLNGLLINDIEIDGANRKWFATNNAGVVLTSENGTEEIYHFTAENSPLFSNKVIDIEINQESGEVFFATDKGLISYRSGATEGSNDFSNVLVFPNPVKPDYEGTISIKGLLTDAVVKITDISGNLVYKTTALGGQANWDGKRTNGEEVNSGVYLIFCSDEDGNENHVSKLLIVRD